MPISIGNVTGSPATDDIATYVTLPDTNGGTVHVEGRVQHKGLPAVTVNADVTAPAAPGSGSIYWIIEVDYTTGTPQVMQSTVAMPTSDPNNIVIFQQTLAASATDTALVSTDVTPDTA